MSWTRLPDEISSRSGLASAERRFAVVMALLGIVFGLRLVSNDSTFWNFPCNSPCVHTTFWAKPMLDYWIYSWIGYAIFSFLYFSVDYFEKYSRGESFRELFGRIATVLLYIYPAFVVFVAVVAEGSYLLPGWAQGVYWFFSFGVLGLMVIYVAQTIVGRSLFEPYFADTRTIIGFMVLGFRIQGGSLHYRVLKLLARFRGQEIVVRELPVKGKFRLEVLSIIGSLVAVTTSMTWTFTDIRGWNLLGVVDGVLIGFMILSTILGWRSDRRDSSRKNSELRVPRHLWSRFRSRCVSLLLGWVRRSRVGST